MPLRYYQNDAKAAVFNYWSETPGNPLVVAATGTGKSLMQGSLTCDLLNGWSDMRIMNTAHVVELVEGNFKELIGLDHFAPAGIWASSLGRQDRRAQVLFSQLQSVHDKAEHIGHVDVMQIDEAHLVPFKQATMYRRLIDDLLDINPDMKINGFTATDYRLDGGRLTEGEDKLFDEVVYEYNIRQGIDDGYLTPITSTRVETRYDLTGVGRSMGEYKAKDYRNAVDTDELNNRIVQEVLETEGNRKKALIFCRGIEHAARVRDAFKKAGRKVELVHGGTPKGERRALIEKLKSGELWGLVNDNVLSTGTNIVGVDLIVDLYRTMSACRYVQRVGRGTRVIYPYGFDPEAVDAAARRAAIAGWIKPNCRYMDFAGNIMEHGPVDMIEPKEPGKGTGEAPIRICPQEETDANGHYGCGEQLHASVRKCWKCGFEFPEPEVKIQDRASDAPILSSTEAAWRTVTSRRFDFHEGKGEKPPSVKVSYMCGLTSIREWLCPQHQGFAKSKADRWWHKHGGSRPFPSSVMEWLERQRELVTTDEIAVKPDGKYWSVTDHRQGTEREFVEADNDNVSAANDNVPAGHTVESWGAVLDDDIPF